MDQDPGVRARINCILYMIDCRRQGKVFLGRNAEAEPYSLGYNPHNCLWAARLNSTYIGRRALERTWSPLSRMSLHTDTQTRFSWVLGGHALRSASHSGLPPVLSAVPENRQRTPGLPCVLREQAVRLVVKGGTLAPEP
jgi:hypothetical protein